MAAYWGKHDLTAVCIRDYQSAPWYRKLWQWAFGMPTWYLRNHDGQFLVGRLYQANCTTGWMMSVSAGWTKEILVEPGGFARSERVAYWTPYSMPFVRGESYENRLIKMDPIN